MDSQNPDENIACQGCENVFTRIVGYELSCLACVEAVRNIQNSGILLIRYEIIFTANMLFLYPDSSNLEELIQVSQKDVHQIDENTSINDDAAGNTENVNEISNENNYNEDDFFSKCSFENCNSEYIGTCNECNNIEKCYCADHFNHDLHTSTNDAETINVHNDDNDDVDDSENLETGKNHQIIGINVELTSLFEQFNNLTMQSSIQLKTFYDKEVTYIRLLPESETKDVTPSNRKKYFVSTEDKALQFNHYKCSYINVYTTFIIQNKKQQKIIMFSPAMIYDKSGKSTDEFILGMWVQSCSTKGVQGLVYNSKTKLVRRESDIKKVLKEGQYTNVHHSYDDDHRLK